MTNMIVVALCDV